MKTPIRKLVEDLETILAMLENHERPRSHRDTLSKPEEFEVMAHVLQLASRQVKVIAGLAGGTNHRASWALTSKSKTA